MLQPGWIRTLLPMSANWIEVRAPTLQSLPILTSAAITAPAPITVPAPISTFGPITASGSTMTPSSRCALGSMMADAAIPELPNQDCGRSESRCSSRATFTKARNGCAARKIATWAGTAFSKRWLIRQAPARVEASWSAYLRLSKNVRCIGPASSSEASPLTSCPPREASTKCASASAASEASVDEGGRSKKLGCAIPPVAVRPVIEPEIRSRITRTDLCFCLETFSSREPAPASLENGLERGAAAELELLHAVKLTFGKRDGIVEAQRTERRGPDQADADRAADRVASIILQSQTGSRVGRIVGGTNAAGRVDFAGQGPVRRPLVVIQAAGIGIDRALQAHSLRQEPERHLQLHRGAPIFGAAERVHRTVRVDVARTDAVRRKAADEVRAHLELIEHAKLVAADLVENAALDVDQSDDIGDQRGEVFRVDRALQIGDVAADAGEILLPVDQQAIGRVLVVVERIVVQRIADRGGQRVAARQFLANRQRGLAVAVAPQAHARGVCCAHGSECIHKRWRRVEGKARIVRVVITIGEIRRQRDGLLIDRIPDLQRKVLAQCETQSRSAAGSGGAVRNIVVGKLLAIERVKTKGDAVVEQIRIDI